MSATKSPKACSVQTHFSGGTPLPDHPAGYSSFGCLHRTRRIIGHSVRDLGRVLILLVCVWQISSSRIA